MLEGDLLDLVDSVLKPLGSETVDGDELREPPLEILRYSVRRVRVSSIPFLGRGLSVVAIARLPIDLATATSDRLLDRLGDVIGTRFPPLVRGHGLALGFTAVVTTPEPIRGDEEAILDRAVVSARRQRAIPLGLLRVNLGQQACAFALRSGPGDAFPEPLALAEAFSQKFRRYTSFPAIDG